jgi:hypothetical protein
LFLEEGGDGLRGLMDWKDLLDRTPKPLETNVKRFAPAFRKSVRVEQEHAPSLDLKLVLDERSGSIHAERRDVFIDFRERRAALAEQEGRAMPRQHEPEGREILGQHSHQQRDQFSITEVPMILIQVLGDLFGRPAQQCVRAEGISHLAHQRGGRQAVARYVADRKDEVT